MQKAKNNLKKWQKLKKWKIKALFLNSIMNIVYEPNVFGTHLNKLFSRINYTYFYILSVLSVFGTENRL